MKVIVYAVLLTISAALFGQVAAPQAKADVPGSGAKTTAQQQLEDRAQHRYPDAETELAAQLDAKLPSGGQLAIQQIYDLLTNAADQGYAPAQRQLGLMYAHGHVVGKDESKALELLSAAAAQGDSEAEKALMPLRGSHYLMIGLIVCVALVFLWFMLATFVRFNRGEQVSWVRLGLACLVAITPIVVLPIWLNMVYLSLLLVPYVLCLEWLKRQHRTSPEARFFGAMRYGQLRDSRGSSRSESHASDDPFELLGAGPLDGGVLATNDLWDDSGLHGTDKRDVNLWPAVNPASGLAMVEGTGIDVGGNAIGTDSHHHDTGIGAGMPGTNPWDH